MKEIYHNTTEGIPQDDYQEWLELYNEMVAHLKKLLSEDKPDIYTLKAIKSAQFYVEQYKLNMIEIVQGMTLAENEFGIDDGRRLLEKIDGVNIDRLKQHNHYYELAMQYQTDDGILIKPYYHLNNSEPLTGLITEPSIVGIISDYFDKYTMKPALFLSFQYANTNIDDVAILPIIDDEKGLRVKGIIRWDVVSKNKNNVDVQDGI